MVAWLSGNGIGHLNNITVHWAQLALRWVTTHKYAILLCNQLLRPTQPLTLSGMGNKYRSRTCGSALQLGR